MNDEHFAKSKGSKNSSGYKKTDLTDRHRDLADSFSNSNKRCSRL